MAEFTRGAPTVQTYKALMYAYQYFNQALFNTSLPEVLFAYHRQKRVMGYASFKRWKDANGADVDELAINPEYFAKFPLIEIFQTLVHEMVHIWQTHHGSPSRRNYHNVEWAKQMEAIGLMPSDTGKPGGKKTGDVMMDFPIYKEPFFNASKKLIKSGFQIPLVDKFPVYRLEKPIIVYDRTGNQYEITEKCELVKELGPIKLSSGSATSSLSQKSVEEEFDSQYRIESQTIEHDFAAPLLTKPISKSGRIKYSCPSCGMNMWGKPNLEPGCWRCMVRLIPQE